MGMMGKTLVGCQRRPLARQSRAGTDNPYSVAAILFSLLVGNGAYCMEGALVGNEEALVGNLGEHEDDTGDIAYSYS